MLNHTKRNSVETAKTFHQTNMIGESLVFNSLNSKIAINNFLCKSKEELMFSFDFSLLGIESFSKIYCLYILLTNPKNEYG